MPDLQINLCSAVLVLVDFQRAFDSAPWPRRWNAEVDANATEVLTAFRRARIPVIHVRHDSVEPGSTLRPGQPGHAFRQGLEPREGEPIVAKSVNSAFIGTDLNLRLRRMSAETVLVCGISTDMCVSTTVRTGANLGWNIVLIGDACDCFDLPKKDGGVHPAELVHEVHLATLAFEFCNVATREEVLNAVRARSPSAPS